MRARTVVSTLAVAVVAAVAPPAPAAPARPAPPRAAQVAGDAFPAYDLGIQNRPYNVAGRDAGYSANVDGTILWAYGDTFAGGDDRSRSNTAALGVQGFNLTREPVDGTGFPTHQMIPYSLTESTFNDDDPGDLPRYWVWPTGIIPRPAPQTSLVFWLRGRQPAVTGTGAVGLADISEGETVADRRPTAIFGGQDCGWETPVLGHDGKVYLYANKDAPTADRASCPNGSSGGFNVFERMVARVPLDEAGTRGSYEFWTGSGWSTSQAAAVDVMDLLNPTVSWSAGLGKWLAVGGIGADHGSYSTAPNPWGPWTAPQQLVTPRPAVAGTHGNYAWMNHPELGDPDGEVMMVTYHRSVSTEGGDIQQLAVDTRPNALAELEAYVTRTYQTFLGRNPTEAALDDWVDRLRDRDDTVPELTQYLARSNEGLELVVEQVYQAVLGRAAGEAEEDYWAGQMATNGWGHDVLLPKVAAAPELSGAHPGNADYVETVYPMAVGRPALPGDVTYWSGQLGSGLARETFVRTLLRSAEGVGHQVELAYQEILGRAATADQRAGVRAVVKDRIAIRMGVAATAEAIGL